MTQTNPDIASYERFFSDLSQVNKIFRETRQVFNRRLADGFNPFFLLNVNEVALSRVIRELLDPAGTHGQGDVFLRLFWDRVWTNKEHTLDTSSVHVSCEAPTTHNANQARRLDVLVVANGKALAIENKPWAGEQENQVGDYISHLRNKYGKGNFKLVFLSQDGREPQSMGSCAHAQPSSADEPCSSPVECMSFKDGFRKWLVECSQQSQAERVRWLLGSLIEYIDADLKEQSNG
ncbi:PD-(D/E)XK nuclease family protein [Desulfocurvibacter africanus]|uniref:PDDEXK-like family protein n=1 Tax=Desulfocurvibacter africanus TaxID=873 RepID=UPI002FDA81A3